jgi:hypothetical protein
VLYAPVCIPRDALIPSKVTKSARGTRPGGGGLFLLSVTAHTTRTRIVEPKNYRSYAINDIHRRIGIAYLLEETRP